jgi:PAS domain S-box-containing protein
MTGETPDLDLIELILESHRQLVGKPLLDFDDLASAARWLYEEAPFCLLAHGPEADPRFIYANRAAQRCFEFSRDELVGLPSRLSAAAPNRAERDALLRQVASRGYAEGYRGLRIAKSGRRFWIEDVTVWNLLDPKGHFYGQAACYRHTSPAEGPGL